MDHADVFKTNAQSVARVHAAEAGPWHQWTADELRAMLVEQLTQPIKFDSKFMSGEMVRNLMSLRSANLPNRFCDLFAHPAPPLGMLEYAKQIAKATRHHPDSPLQKISTIVYYSAILVAVMRCGKRITELTDPALRQGVEWVLRQSWIDPSTRALFCEGLRYLQSLETAAARPPQ
jgi:hypothetical protein